MRRRLDGVLPEDEGVGGGLGDGLLVAVVVDGVGVVGARGELEDERGAGGGVDGADGGVAVDERDVGAVEGVGDAAGEVLRLRDPGGLEGEPGRGGEFAGGGRELGGVEVDAGAGGGGVEEDAGGGALVVGDAGAVVEGERSEGRGGVGGLVVFAGEDDVEAAGGEE